MRELLADLLAYTQMNVNRWIPHSPSISTWCWKNTRELPRGIDETGVVITSDPLPTIQGHEPHFLLFQNLISNAIKYRGDKAPVIHVAATNMNGVWRLAVSDNGIGIAPEYHQRVFGVFKRLHGRMIPGTGMGLAICQRVVERYHGRIWIESPSRSGVDVFVHAFGEGGQRVNEPRFRILLVEDNAGDVYLLRKALAAAQVAFDWTVLEDGAQALAFVRGERTYAHIPIPDLVLLDLNLPKNGGLQVLTAIRQHPRLAAVPVMVTSSSQSPRDRGARNRSAGH